jgi:outer membrane protein OmpA-like peptidoglycan-associated protein
LSRNANSKKRSRLWPVLYTALAVLVLASTYVFFYQEKYEPYIKKVKTYYRQFVSLDGSNPVHKTITPAPPSVPESRPNRTKTTTSEPDPTKLRKAPKSASISEGLEDQDKTIAEPTSALQEIPLSGGGPEANPSVEREDGPPPLDRPAVSIDEDFKMVVPFDYDKNEISSEAHSDLDQVASSMVQNPEINIVIEGYTDTLGSHHYNVKLSEFRALVVKSYLVGKGIRPERIQAVGMAERNPVAENDTVTGRAANRRVEIRLRTD